MKRKPTVIPTALGLALLLVVIITVVLYTPPDFPRNAGQLQTKLEQHQAACFFLIGESLAKRLFSNPLARWSHFGIDPDSPCIDLKNGVWFAMGTVKMANDKGQVFQTAWQTIFYPDTRTLLYSRVGNMELGDSDAAAKAAGLSPQSQQGNSK